MLTEYHEQKLNAYTDKKNILHVTDIHFFFSLTTSTLASFDDYIQNKLHIP